MSTIPARCDTCGKFASWDKLKRVNSIPDTPFGGEDFELICEVCKEAGKHH